MNQNIDEKNLTFEDRYSFIVDQIDKRRSTWRLSNLDWEDAAQIILIRVWKKYDTFDADKGKFEHWLNTLISRAIKNLLRDNLYKYARPCITSGSSGGPCIYNLGGEICGFTKSKKQCSECPLYAKWQEKKENQFNIKDALPIENHTQEVHSMANEDVDIDRIKDIIDEEMQYHLNAFEYNIYKMIYIDNIPENIVGKKLKYKTPENPGSSNGKSKAPGYQMIRLLKKKIVTISQEIMDEKGLI